MADSYGTATVDTTADVIVANLTERRVVLIKNVGSIAVYIGFDASVATTTGFPLNPQGSLEIAFKNTKRGQAIYGITASSSTEVRYLLMEQ